jgi:hypothetical protein
MKKRFFFLSILFINTTFAQIWNKITNENNIHVLGERTIVPKKYIAFHLTDSSFKKTLWSAPSEKNTLLANSNTIVELPMPDGNTKRFRIVESPTMTPELAAQFPSIKTFNAMDVEGRGITGKLDWTEMGFHAMLRTVDGDIFIDPYCRNNTVDYIAYYKKDFEKANENIAGEFGDVLTPSTSKKKNDVNAAANTEKAITCIGNYLRTYRLAVACTGEYAKAATGQSTPTIGQTLSAIVTTVTRVDGVYETEFAIKLVLIAGEASIIFTDPDTDPFTGNNDGSILIDESQTVIDDSIGDANYDVGHTFSTGGGGLSTLGGVCVSGRKASSITGGAYPVGDPYDIDYVAHEMGHDFGGNHTFRAVTGSCQGNQNFGTMVEPGSGITIMAYAGICAPNDDSSHSIPYFHAISFDEIIDYTHNDDGNSCPTLTPTGNSIPTVNSTANFTIPVSTPFILTGSATDADGDVLRYSWEEVDNNSFGGNWNDGKKPFFRSYNPTTSSSRMFPKFSVLQSGNYQSTIGEYLPDDAQNLNFRLTVRDNKMGGGGVCSVKSSININASGGPFTVSYPNTTGISWGSGSTKTITWNVNGTNLSPINCSTVNILISYDAGNTFTLLMGNVPNSGSQVITVPAVATDKHSCRIKVESVGNVFFDISDKNFTITTTSTAGIIQYASQTFSLNVYPNPSNEVLSVAIHGLSIGENYCVKITDLIGNSILTDTFVGAEQNNLQYSVSKLASGIYLLEISNSTRIQAIARIVKQ